MLRRNSAAPFKLIYHDNARYRALELKTPKFHCLTCSISVLPTVSSGALLAVERACGQSCEEQSCAASDVHVFQIDADTKEYDTYHRFEEHERTKVWIR